MPGQVAVRAIAIASVIAALGHVARADGAGVIAVDGGEVAAAMTAAMTGRAARLEGDAIAVARAARREGAVPVEALARFATVRAQVDDGWRAYLRVAVDVAVVKLGAARAEAEPLVALPGGREVYADVALRLGAALANLGREDEARAVMALALAMDPARPITLAEFSPDVIERVDAVRAAPAASVRWAIRVDGAPPGLQIAIDGGAAVAAPTGVLTVDAPIGQHLVIATAPGRRTLVRAASVDAAGNVELALDVDAEEDALGFGARRGLEAAGAAVLVDATMRYADLDEVVLAMSTTKRGGPTLLVQRCAGVPAQCSAVVEVGYADASGLAAAAREAWDSVRGGELRYPPSVFGEHGDGRVVAHGCRVCRSPWLWGSIGAAVVVGAVVTAIAVTGDRPSPIVGVPADLFTGR